MNSEKAKEQLNNMSSGEGSDDKTVLESVLNYFYIV